MNEALLERIGPVVKRMRRVRFFRIMSAVLVLIGIVGWLMRLQVASGRISGTTLAISLLAFAVASALVTALVCRMSFRNLRDVARQIEAKFPSLDHRLLTALSQQDHQMGYLQQRVVKEARDHSRRYNWAETVPSSRVLGSQVSGLVAGLFCAVVLGALFVMSGQSEATGSSATRRSQQVTVSPGSTEVERGSSLVVTARFEGWVPEQAELVCQYDDGSERRFPMTQNLKDPVLGGFISSVDQPFRYRVLSPIWESETFSVEVFEFPDLVRSDADLRYPDYTGMEPKRIEDTVRVAAVQGTQVKWICYLNKDVKSAELVAEDGTRMPLETDAENPGARSTTLDLQETMRLKLELRDDADRANKYPPELVARVLPNQPPDLKLSVAGDVSVSPLEELPIAAEVSDDFGVVKYGLAYSFAGNPEQEISLGESLARGAKSAVEHLIEFEKLKAQPDELLTYHFWAEDYGPDGNLRRTESDMYFAEVRPFEEIFREGEPPPAGQSQQQQQQSGQNGQKAEELAELQKEIINATWRVIREEPVTKRSDDFDANMQLLIESQQDALAQLEELAGEVQDERSIRFVDTVRTSMQSAIEELMTAAQDRETTTLNPALDAEKAAYGSLLRLRAREFEVSRSRQQNQPQSGSASQNRRQRQMDELELDQEENRYETESQAQESSQEDQQQREVRQVLNRLRDLARRQEDLNKELAQLQSALEEAKTEEEKEEIQRQLKRLREQQQDLLRETDELNERMQQPENQQSMQQASDQLQETRENVRQAGEALERNDAAEALTAGRRAEREFEEMRDEFRQQAAGEFNETVRQLRADAQELDQKQESLSEELKQLDQPDQNAGLRGSNNREQIREDLQQQAQSLNQLLERMRTTVEESEATEPLLAQKLYDSFRQTQQQQIEQRLLDASELLQRGFEPQAREMESTAGQGIDQLRQDLESAAESVLGDETKALQRALSELERLQRDLEGEMQRNGKPGSAETQPSTGQQQDGQQQDGQQQDGQQQDGQQQDGQQQDGQQQDGQQQGGQQQGGQQQGGQQQGGQQQDGQQQGEQQQGEQQQGGQQQGGQQQGGQQQGGQQQGGQQQGEQQQGGQQQVGQRQGGQQLRGQQQGGESQGGNQTEGSAFNRWAAGNPNSAPLTGEDFREWTDRLRDVEEMVGDPQLRSEAARIRDRARDVRQDLRRHGKEPQWDLVEKMIASPLRELKQRVAEEVLRRSAEKHAPVPIDRDPVPVQYAEAVRQYYESLGSGR